MEQSERREKLAGAAAEWMVEDIQLYAKLDLSPVQEDAIETAIREALVKVFEEVDVQIPDCALPPKQR